MNLSTRYLGLELSHPFIPGASPLAEDLDMVVRLEDAGAPAIVMHSLFEEEILAYDQSIDTYLEQLQRIKSRVAIPVIASFNGTTAAGWLQYARLIAHAGANALELNFYYVATDGREDGRAVERRVIDIVAVMKESIRLPLAVKLSPFFSSLPNIAAQLEALGADGLVLFNRFYQPDIDPERRRPTLCLHYSDPSELPLRLRWIAILAGRTRMALSLSGGVHEPLDALKALMAGADTVQLVSTLLLNGPERLTQIRQEIERWVDEHQVASLQELRGCASLSRCGDPQVFARGNYVNLLRRKSDSDGRAVSFS